MTVRTIGPIASIAIVAGGVYWLRDRFFNYYYLISRPSLRTRMHLEGRERRRKHHHS